MISRICSLLRVKQPAIEDRGLLWASGATVPSAVDGYQVGAIFQHTDGSAGDALYVNEGSITSCTFNALTGGSAATTLTGLTDVGAALGYAAGKVLVADGTDYEEVAISGDATLAANGALTIAAGAVTPAMTETMTNGKLIVGVTGGPNIAAAMSGDVTMDATGAVTIATGAVESTMVEDLGDTKILVGTGGGNSKVALSGDVTMANDGAVTIAALAVESGMIAVGAVAVTNIEGLTAGQFPIGTNGTGAGNSKATMSGDATMNSSGVLTIAEGAVEDSMIEGLADGEFIIGVDGTAANNAKVTMTGPFNLSNAGLISMDSATVAAAGSNQGDAAAVADGYTLTTGGDGTKGVKLPAAAAGGLCVIKNNASSALKVYPNTDDKIDDGSANAAITVSAERAVILVAYDGTDWYTVGDYGNALADLYDVGATAYTAGSLLVGSGTAYAEVALSGPFNLSAAGLLSMDSATVAATGSAQGDAAAVADGFTLVTDADATKGVKLPTAAAGGLCVIKNNASAVLKVYPNTDDKIDDGSANAAISVSAERTVVLVAYDGTDWYTAGDSGNALADLYDVGATDYTAGKILVGSGTAYAEQAVGGDATLGADGSLTIATGAVEDSMIEGLADGEFIIGVDGTAANNAKVTMSGDATLANTGALTIATGAVEDSMIEGLADGEFIIGVDGTAANNAKVTMSSHATLANNGALTLATVTKTFGIPLNDLRQEDAWKDVLPDAPDGDGGTLGLADAIGSPVLGTSTNNTAASESCGFLFVVPEDWSDGDLTVRIKFLFDVARTATSNLDVIVRTVKAGGLDATDLCLTSPIDVKAVTSETNEDFTIDHDATGDEIAAGTMLWVAITIAADDTGGGSAGVAQINGVQVLVPCYR